MEQRIILLEKSKIFFGHHLSLCMCVCMHACVCVWFFFLCFFAKFDRVAVYSACTIWFSAADGFLSCPMCTFVHQKCIMPNVHICPPKVYHVQFAHLSTKYAQCAHLSTKSFLPLSEKAGHLNHYQKIRGICFSPVVSLNTSFQFKSFFILFYFISHCIPFF